MWLKKFTIAIVEKDTDALKTLMDEIPKFEKKSDIDATLSLIEEAKKLVESLKNDTEKSMIQIQKNIKFLKSTQAPIKSSLDISS